MKNYCSSGFSFSVLPPIKYGFAMSAMLLCLAWCLLSASVLADDGRADGNLRERIKQRIAERQESRQGDDNHSAHSQAITVPGDYVRSLKHDGITRSYRIHVPPQYSAATPAALLLAFHGGGGDMDYMAKDEFYGLISKADAEGFIVIFPNGYSKFRSGKFATWNAGACCANARDNNIDDVGFVRKILKQVSSELVIDKRRVFATGMSNGGMMSYRLACEMPGTFSAIAAVAGTDNTLTCAPALPVSILHIHAKNDDRVLFNGGAGDKFRDESKVTDFTSVPATIAKWIDLNKCSGNSHPVLNKPGAYCEQYSHCKGGTAVQLCVTETGGHSWPGGSKPRADKPPSQALSANDVMWDFFKSINSKAR